MISDPCVDCDGEGRRQEAERVSIRIPAGVDDGNRLRSTGKGDAGLRGGPAGDLYVFLNLKEHEVFQRESDELFCEIPLPFSTAALGGELEVPTLTGSATIKVPAGTQGGTIFRLRDRGMPSLSGRGKGSVSYTHLRAHET